MDAHTLECLDFARVRELLTGYAMCGLGKSLASEIRPASKVQIVRRWLQQVREVQRLVDERGLPPFAGISDVRELVRRSAPPLRLNAEEVARIGATLRATHEVVGYLHGLADDLAELQTLAARIGDFRPVADRISRVIDERGAVRDDASDKLARVRRSIDEATTAIRAAVQKLLRDPDVLRVLQYGSCTFHNDRIVLPVRAEFRGRVAGIIHRSSDSGATVYVEPAAAVELNNEISRLRADEEEEVNRLLWELAHEIHLNEEAIRKTLDALAVLDLVVAKVRFARDFGMVCPNVNDDGRIVLRQARHPLLIDLLRRAAGEEAAANGVVPIDVRLGDDFDMLIITGPNTGGKTVALKTVGLLCVMIHAGLPIPAQPGADVALLQNVMIDVGDEQSMQQSLSTFSAHVRRVMEMLQRATRRTLVLIDELGAGTDPDEGAAIGRAVLDELLARGSRVIVTTHLGALKAYPFTRQRVENASVEFDIQTLSPTYRLRIGEPGNSNAIDIAERLGFPRRLVAAARRHLLKKDRVLRTAIARTAESKRAAEDARLAADDARAAACAAQAAADSERDRLQRQQRDYEAWVRRVVHLRPGDRVRVRNFDRDGRLVRLMLDQQRAEIDIGPFAVEAPLGDLLPPDVPPPPPPEPRRAGVWTKAALRGPAATAPRHAAPRRNDGRRHDGALPAARVALRDARGPRPQREPRYPALPSISDSQAQALKPGDAVYAKRFHREGRIVRVNPAKRLALVTVGVLELELPFSGLALPPSSTSAVVAPAPHAAEERAPNAPASHDDPPPATLGDHGAAVDAPPPPA